MKISILSNKRILWIVLVTGILIGTVFFSISGIQDQNDQNEPSYKQHLREKYSSNGLDCWSRDVVNRRITASQEKINEFSSIGLDSHFDDGVPGWVCEIMQRTRFRNLGTAALQLAYVAKGGLIATIVSRAKLWDIAAGALIVETAGALLSDWQGGKIFPVDLDDYQDGELQAVAANKKVHKELLKLIKS